MDRKTRFRSFVLPSFLLALSIANFARLPGNENIRAIQMVSLIVIGVLLGILLRNLFGLVKK